MLHLLIAALAGVWLQTSAPASQVRSRPADIAFRVQMIDPGFSESVAVADFNKDGRRDILSAECIYWYEFRPGLKGTVEWIRHIVDYGGRAGGGLQMVVEDIDRDGDLDVITPGKTGLFLSENLTRNRSGVR